MTWVEDLGGIDKRGISEASDREIFPPAFPISHHSLSNVSSFKTCSDLADLSFYLHRVLHLLIDKSLPIS